MASLAAETTDGEILVVFCLNMVAEGTFFWKYANLGNGTPGMICIMVVILYGTKCIMVVILERLIYKKNSWGGGGGGWGHAADPSHLCIRHNVHTTLTLKYWSGSSHGVSFQEISACNTIK